MWPSYKKAVDLVDFAILKYTANYLPVLITIFTRVPLGPQKIPYVNECNTSTMALPLQIYCYSL